MLLFHLQKKKYLNLSNFFEKSKDPVKQCINILRFLFFITIDNISNVSFFSIS